MASFKLKEKWTLIAVATSIGLPTAGQSSNKAMFIQHRQTTSKKPMRIWRGRLLRSSRGFRTRLALIYSRKDLAQVSENLNQGKGFKWSAKAQINWRRVLVQTLLDLDLPLLHAVAEATSLTIHFVRISEAQPPGQVGSTLQEVQI